MEDDINSITDIDIFTENKFVSKMMDCGYSNTFSELLFETLRIFQVMIKQIHIKIFI